MYQPVFELEMLSVKWHVTENESVYRVDGDPGSPTAMWFHGSPIDTQQDCVARLSYNRNQSEKDTNITILNLKNALRYTFWEKTKK